MAKPNAFDAVRLWLSWAEHHAAQGISPDNFLRKLPPEEQKKAAELIRDLVACLDRWRENGEA